MKTIVWRPGTPTSSIRPTTAQQGRPFTSAGVGTGVQLDGELMASVPDTLVVGDVGEVYRQILAWGGACKVVIDTTLGAAVLPAGMVWPGFGVDPTSGAALTRGDALLYIEGDTLNALTTSVRITDTAQILGVRSLKNVTLNCDCVTTQAYAIGSLCELTEAVIANRAGALVPACITQDSFSGRLLTLGRCSLDNALAAHPILQLGSTGGDAGSVLSVVSQMGLTVGAAGITASNVATSGVTFFHDASVASGYLQTQLGALTVTDLGGPQTGANTLYTPAVGANWVNPDPTTVGAAIDRIAAVLAAGGGGAANPIP